VPSGAAEQLAGLQACSLLRPRQFRRIGHPQRIRTTKGSLSLCTRPLSLPPRPAERRACPGQTIHRSTEFVSLASWRSPPLAFCQAKYPVSRYQLNDSQRMLKDSRPEQSRARRASEKRRESNLHRKGMNRTTHVSRTYHRLMQHHAFSRAAEHVLRQVCETGHTLKLLCWWS
jgi:hypothetical protein